MHQYKILTTDIWHYRVDYKNKYIEWIYNINTHLGERLTYDNHFWLLNIYVLTSEKQSDWSLKSSIGLQWSWNVQIFDIPVLWHQQSLCLRTAQMMKRNAPNPRNDLSKFTISFTITSFMWLVGNRLDASSRLSFFFLYPTLQ